MFIHLSMRQLLRIKKVFVECSSSKDSEEMDRFGIRNKYRNVKRSMIMKHSFQDFVCSYGETGGQGCSGTEWYLDITLEVWCRIWKGLLLLKCLLSKSEVYSLHL